MDELITDEHMKKINFDYLLILIIAFVALFFFLKIIDSQKKEIQHLRTQRIRLINELKRERAHKDAILEDVGDCWIHSPLNKREQEISRQ